MQVSYFEMCWIYLLFSYFLYGTTCKYDSFDIPALVKPESKGILPYKQILMQIYVGSSAILSRKKRWNNVNVERMFYIYT